MTDPTTEAMEAWHSAMNDVGELRANAPDERYAKRAERVESWIKANRPSPPSAPVGVKERAKAIAAEFCPRGDYDHGDVIEAIEYALAQQPAADGGFTAADMMDARQEGRKEAQHPAAVDEAMVERATMTLLGKSYDMAPGVDWRCDRAWTVNKVRKHMRAALTAALAAQQGGAK